MASNHVNRVREIGRRCQLGIDIIAVGSDGGVASRRDRIFENHTGIIIFQYEDRSSCVSPHLQERVYFEKLFSAGCV